MTEMTKMLLHRSYFTAEAAQEFEPAAKLKLRERGKPPVSWWGHYQSMLDGLDSLGSVTVAKQTRQGYYYTVGFAFSLEPRPASKVAAEDEAFFHLATDISWLTLRYGENVVGLLTYPHCGVIRHRLYSNTPGAVTNVADALKAAI